MKNQGLVNRLSLFALVFFFIVIVYRLRYHIDMHYLETDRIYLRHFQEEDLQDFFDYSKVPGVGEKAGWNHHETIEDSRMILYKNLIPNPDDYAIVDKKTGKVIGSFGLHLSSTRVSNDFPEEKVKELGYVLAKNYWGQGIMTEILSAALIKWTEERKCDVLTAIVFSDNKESAHVLEKCGFRHYRIVKDCPIEALNQTKDEYYFYLRLS